MNTRAFEGQRFGPYELEKRAASGAMAEVWLARSRDGALIALKMVAPHLARDDRFQRALVREYALTSRIASAHVVRVIELGEHEGAPFFTMEWLDGIALSDAALPMALDDVLQIGIDLSAAATSAHAEGIVHRDVAPANAMRSPRGRTTLIDFGLAIAHDDPKAPTEEGGFVGNISYISPEQAFGRLVDARSDVWAIAAVMIKLLIGSAPYEGENELATLRALEIGAPSFGVSPSWRRLPDAVRAVLERALAREPDQRFASARALGVALESLRARIDLR